MHSAALMLCLLLGVACNANAAERVTTEDLLHRADAHLLAHSERLIAFRHDLHRHPEPSGEEMRTAGHIAARLRELGFEVRTRVGGHGVVGVLHGALPGPVVAFRADMDAMRDDTPDPVDYRSEHPGLRHICGHDVHATLGVALAETFAALRPALPGTLVLVFQPAEERATGAALMLAEGALTSPLPSAIYAVHTAPFEVGTFATSTGVLMASRDRLSVQADGEAAEPVVRAIVERLRKLDDAPPFALQPNGSNFVSVSARALEVGATSAQATIDFALASDAARAHVRRGVDEAVSAEQSAYAGTRVRIVYTPRWIPGVRNDATLARRAIRSVRATFGEAAVIEDPGVSPAFSEDFGHMQAQVPGVMLFLGVSNASRGWVGMPHTPGYVADDAAIAVGARALTRVLLDELTRER